jgi:hypothetical protein
MSHLTPIKTVSAEHTAILLKLANGSAETVSLLDAASPGLSLPPNESIGKGKTRTETA